MRTSEISQLVRAYTGGTMNIEHLRGAAMRFARMELMTKITGTNTDYSIGDLYGALFELFGIDGLTHTDMQAKLIERMSDWLPFKHAEA